MEKGKSGNRRGAPPKVRALPPPGDFIALGSKSSGISSRTGTDSPLDSKLSGSSKSSSSSLSLDRKRDSPTGSITAGAKKLKFSGSVSAIPSIGRSLVDRKELGSTVITEPWEALAEPVEAAELVNIVMKSDDEEKIDGILCGAIKQLKNPKSKTEACLCLGLGLAYLSKVRSQCFCSKLVIEALCSVLKRNSSIAKAKSTLLPVMCANMLFRAVQHDAHWSENLIKVYVDDSVSDRSWVDHLECKIFVDNLQTAFGTNLPPLSFLQSDINSKPDSPNPSSSAGVAVDDYENSDSALLLECHEIMDGMAVQPRFSLCKTKVENIALEVAKEQLSRRQNPADVPKNVIRFLASICGLIEVRLLAVQRLESWFPQVKTSKTAEFLMMSVCMNCRMVNQQDVEVISCLTRIRFKSKSPLSHYLLCIKELLSTHPENLHTVLKHVIYNELSNARNPNNMALLSVIFHHSPELASKMLAEVFQDLLANRDDYLRALRALLREIVRSLRYDMPFTVFCLGLMTDRKEQMFKDLDPPMKERMFLSLSDLITMTMFLAISPPVKEAAAAFNRGDRKDLHVLKTYQNNIAIMQRDAVWWMHTVVMNAYKVGKNEFNYCLRKILFIDPVDQYAIKDNWPSEPERPMMIRLASEVPILEDTLMRILIIGLSKDHPLVPQDALDYAEKLVCRAAFSHIGGSGDPVLLVERLELIELLFNLSVYHYPDSIILPKGYQPPSLAISKSYWSVWLILLLTVAHNPENFGSPAWQTYSTLQMLIEMSITGHFKFPPPTSALGEKADEIKNKELQLSQLEKQEIIQFESHLAAASTNATITEETSLLLSQLTTLDPQGIAREPPPHILEQLKELNNKLKLGHLLCRSREPDFLLDIIQRQGTSESMPWLVDLVASSSGSFEMLPRQCLCEFLLHESLDENRLETGDKTEKAKHKLKQKIQVELLHYVKTLLFDSSADPKPTVEIIEYFLQRLYCKQAASRVLAAKSLQLVLCRSPEMEDDAETDLTMDHDDKENIYGWVPQLTLLPHFKDIKRTTGECLRQACTVENNPVAVGAYIKFLACYHPADTLQDLSDLALDVANVLVNRTTLINTLMPLTSNSAEVDYSIQNAFIRIFISYLPRALKLDKDAFSWSISQDQILVQWCNGYAATMHIFVAHAMVVLLSYGPPADNPKYFETLLEYWFPSEGEPPQAFLVDTSELALLLPDWLKLRMLSSKVVRLVDAALKDLEPTQLVLFVQSFGIPIETVSKLLSALDAVAQIDSKSIRQAVVDKPYMCQLVDVQQQRGAVCGNKFVGILSEYKETDDSEVEMKPEIEEMPISPSAKLRDQPLQGSIINSIFKLFNPVSPGAQRAIFDSFMKKISRIAIKKQLNSFIPDIQLQMTEVLLSPNGKNLILGLHKYLCYSCALFSLLYRCQSDEEIMTLYLPLIEIIINQSVNRKSPLLTLLSKHSANLRGVKEKLDHTEEEKLKILKGNWNEKNTNELVSRLINLLKDSVENNNASHPGQLGMFADWLKLIEPEIVKSCPDLEKDLLFSKFTSKSNKLSLSSGRQYLLALVIHHTNWSTIYRTTNLCLNEKSLSKLNPSSVLDFLWACVDMPRLWQGKNKSKSNKNSDSNNVLALTIPQLLCVIDYLIQEASPTSPKNLEENCEEDTTKIISLRLPLLLHCLNNESNLITAAVDYMMGIISGQDKMKSKVCHSILISLYAQLPHIIFKTKHEKIKFSLNDSSITEAGISSLDVFSHNMLTALASIGQDQQGNQRLHDLEIECRKMTASHPLLVLRQLPTIAASLHGRVNFGFSIFCSRNHFAYFTCVMGLLELMKPYIFNKRFELPVQNIFVIYFEFIQVHGMKNKQAIPLTQRIIKFLSDYINFNSNKDCQIIAKHAPILEALAKKYPDLPYLQSVMRNKESNSSESVNVESINPTSITSGRSGFKSNMEYAANYTRAQLSPILTQLSSKFSEDILSALHDLSNIAQRNPSVLKPAFAELKKLLFTSHNRCREVTYDLVLIHLKNDPNCSSDFLPVYLSCLNSENADVMVTALEHLAEVVILAQEFAKELLDKTFSLGISCGIDIKPYFLDILFMLKMQNGL